MSRRKNGPLRLMFCGAFARVLVTKLKRAKAHAGHKASIILTVIAGWLFSVVATVFEPIAFAIHLEDVDVMG